MSKITRRSFLKALVNTFIAGSGLYLYGNKIEMHRPFVMRTKIPIENLADDLVGFRIVAMGDLHIDPMWEVALIERAFALANQTKADLMLLLGDYITHDVNAIYTLEDQFSQLEAKYGVYACLGNHEVWEDAAIAQAALESFGIEVLVNAGTTIEVGQASLYLAGLEPWWNTYDSPNLDVALNRCASRRPRNCHDARAGLRRYHSTRWARRFAAIRA